MPSWARPTRSIHLPKPGEPPLYRAARLGDHEQIRVLVDSGAEVDQLFEIQLDPVAGPAPATPLMVAAGSSEGASAETLSLLLELGASVAPAPGLSALPYACLGLGWNYPPGGDAGRVARLLGAGADPATTAPNGASALACAARSGDRERVRLLLEAGADPAPDNTKERGGYRLFLPFLDPLFMAAESGSAGCVRLLLDSGADVHRFKGIGDIPGEAQALGSLARLYRQTRRFEDAIRFAEKGLGVCEQSDKGGFPRNRISEATALAHRRLWKCYRDAEKLEVAVQLLDESFDMYRTFGDRPGQVLTMTLKAEALWAQGKRKEGDDLADRVKSMLAQGVGGLLPVEPGESVAAPPAEASRAIGDDKPFSGSSEEDMDGDPRTPSDRTMTFLAHWSNGVVHPRAFLSAEEVDALERSRTTLYERRWSLHEDLVPETGLHMKGATACRSPAAWHRVSASGIGPGPGSASVGDGMNAGREGTGQ